MKRMHLTRRALLAFLGITVCASMIVGTNVKAAEDNPFSLYYENGNSIVLNGNSVVIRESETGSDYINIYLDENRNGEVDGTEKAVPMKINSEEESIDIPASMPIYGYRGTSVTSTEPILITMESGVVYDLCGTCLTDINTTSDNAITIRVKGGRIEHALWGAYLADVSVGDGKTAIDIEVSGDAVVKGYVKPIEGSSTGNTIIGNVDVDWNTEELASSENALSSFYGIYNNVEVVGDVDILLDKLKASYVYGLSTNVKVNGNYTYNCKDTSDITSSHEGMENSTVNGNADITVVGSKAEETSTIYVFGIHGCHPNSSNVAVNGTTKVVYGGGYTGNLYAIRAQKVTGDVEVDVKSGCADYTLLMENTTVPGSLEVNVREGFESKDLWVCASCDIDGDVIMDLKNAYADTESVGNCKALCCSNVDGDVAIDIDGGCYNEIRPICGTNTKYVSIGGSVDLAVRNVDCYETTMVLYSEVEGNIDLLYDDCVMDQFFGLSSAIAKEEIEIIIQDSKVGSNSNISHMFLSTEYAKGGKIHISNTSFEGFGGFSPCYYMSEDDCGDVYVDMKNVAFKDSSFIEITKGEGQELYMTMHVDAKVGETTTEEKPLCDLSGFARALMNSEEYIFGDVVGLPEGIEFKNGKLYGTPTTAYENGTEVSFSVIDNYNAKEQFKVHFVIAKPDCEFDSKWSYDEKHHWHACTQACGDESCDEVKDKAEHTWDAGVVTKEATATEKGEKTYTCSVCKTTKTDEIPVLTTSDENTTESKTETTTEDKSETVTPSTKGTVLKDTDKKGDYTVTNADPASPEVSYKVTSKTAKNIVIPDTITVDGVTYKVTSIQKASFKNHKNLKKVTIGANVKTIDKNAFYGCKKLTTVNMGKNVTTIGVNAFYNCTALKSITIPKSVKKIGSKAFYNCKKLTKITIKTTALTKSKVGKKAFTKAGSSNYKKLTVKVPKSKKKAYETMLKSRGLSSKAKVK